MFGKMGGIIAKRMHKETAELFQRGEKSTTDEGAPVYGAPVSLGNIQCNVQPYSADLAHKE